VSRHGREVPPKLGAAEVLHCADRGDRIERPVGEVTTVEQEDLGRALDAGSRSGPSGPLDLPAREGDSDRRDPVIP